MADHPDYERIDKWLWYVRCFKTRSVAKKNVEAGKIRVNGDKATNPSRKLYLGNVLTITMDREIKILEVLGFPQRRGPYVEAKTYYNDLTPEKQVTNDTRSDANGRFDTKKTGKPDKRQRRQILAAKYNSNGEMD